ncbi:MAG TPA: ABC transporter ATP-binding protein [Candidatus Marinimicrobia bacterium]|nr:ABC transporter ATP-binding protein [Candidatus Neomarinimicrobiota bacterium]
MWWNDYEDDFNDDMPGGLSVKAIFQRIWPFIQPYRRTFCFSFFLGLLGVALVLYQPVLLKRIFDIDLPSGEYRRVLLTGLIFLATMLGSAVINFFSSWLLQKAGVHVVNDIKVKLFDHFLRLGLSFLERYPVGKLVSRIESDTQRLVALSSTMILRVIMSIGMLIGAVVILAIIDLRLFAIVFAVIPILFAGTWLMFKWLRPYFREERSKYSEVSAVVAEFVKSVGILQLYNRGSWAEARLKRQNDRYVQFTSRIGFMEYAIFRGLAFMEILVTVVALWLGANWIKAGTLTVGTIVLFAQYIAQIYWPIIMLTDQLAEIQRAGAAADRIFTALDQQPQIKNCEKTIPVPEKISQIEFRNLSFSYSPGKPVLKNVSFILKGGETLALVGPTGGGKSTIVNLVCRFYDPDDGEILVNGINLKNFELEAWRKRFGLVLQDLCLFPASLRDNMRLFRENISDEQIHLALKTAGIERLIQNGHGSLDKIIAERGANLSQGERQLLALARALTLDPELLILDEASSSVDPGTEAAIQQALQKLLEDRTNIIVAHRLSTIRNASQIAVIQNGLIRETGTHEALMNRNGIYADLLETQLVHSQGTAS